MDVAELIARFIDGIRSHRRRRYAAMIFVLALLIGRVADPSQAAPVSHSSIHWTIAENEMAAPAISYKLVYSEPRPGARLGVSVATSGDIILAGARGDCTAGVETGATLVFQWQAGQWQGREPLTAADASAWAHLGYAVAIDGDIGIIGAYKDGQGGFEAGAIYSLHVGPTASNDRFIKYLAPDGSTGDRFGQSVAVDGDIVVVGAPEAQGHGLVYVFEKNEHGLLNIQTTLSAADANPGDHFGHAVAVAGDVIIVGASGADALGENSGAVYVFDRRRPANDTQKLVPDLLSTEALFGKSVAIDGDWIIIGAPTFKNLDVEEGRAFIFEFDQTDLWQQHSIVQPAADQNASLFGLTVDIQGELLAVGAPADDQAARGAGAAYLFRRDENNNWPLDAKITSWDAQEGDAFARSLALGAGLIVVGSVFDDASGRASGSVYIFDLPIAGSLPPLRRSSIESLDPVFPAGHMENWIRYSRDPQPSHSAIIMCPADNQPMADVDPDFFNISGKEISSSFPQLDTLLEQLNAGHAQSVGSKIHWEYLEPVQGQQEWAASDQLFSRFGNASLEPLVTIRGTAQWASSEPSAEQYWLYPPAELDQWRQVVNEIVSRYGGQGMALVNRWEIWNEPNLPSFFLGSTTDYINLLNAAYSAVKEADPRALVYAPAVVFHPWNLAASWSYVDEVISSGSFDVFSIHLYFSDIDNFYTTVTILRQKLDEAGLSQIPIAVTEVNRIESVIDCRDFSALPDWQHAQHLQDIFACLANAGAGSVHWFKSTDRGQNCALPHDDLDLRNGLLDPLWRDKAAYNAFADLAHGRIAIFADGFESGDSTAWTETLGKSSQIKSPTFSPMFITRPLRHRHQ